MNPNLHAVLLAGGSGTRLWPLSTRKQPKQFMILGSGTSLLQDTWARLSGFIPAENGWVVCGQAHLPAVREHLPQLPSRQILAEPQSKNTAAAIGLAALHLRALDPEAVMVILPADHFIPRKDWPAFQRNLEAAAQAATEQELLVTLGIPPTSPATGYGYLERGEALSSVPANGFRVHAFHEKPSPATAAKYAANSDFFWNSGMFVWKAGVYLSELEKYLPETARAIFSLAPILSQSEYSAELVRIFSMLENISVDYAVMEKSKKVCMIPATFSWDDVGNLNSLAAASERDSQGNHISGQAILLDAEGNLVFARNKAVALFGVKDMMVIEGENAILIAPRDRNQDVKTLVEFLKETGREDLL